MTREELEKLAFEYRRLPTARLEERLAGAGPEAIPALLQELLNAQASLEYMRIQNRGLEERNEALIEMVRALGGTP